MFLEEKECEERKKKKKKAIHALHSSHPQFGQHETITTKQQHGPGIFYHRFRSAVDLTRHFVS